MKEDYVYGNAVRKRQEEVEIHPIILERKNDKRFRLTFSNWAMISILTVGLALSVLYSMNLQSEISVADKEYAALYNSYAALRDANNNVEENLENSINSEEIRRIASEQYGMKLAGEGQIVTYAADKADYTEQYSVVDD
ncbi:MAG: hypothetical protein K6C99_04865 [Lachnospiraceae bacterium]|nr:hypothetical protein [Lachnospiraceae bacterium]